MSSYSSGGQCFSRSTSAVYEHYLKHPWDLIQAKMLQEKTAGLQPHVFNSSLNMWSQWNQSFYSQDKIIHI